MFFFSLKESFFGAAWAGRSGARWGALAVLLGLWGACSFVPACPGFGRRAERRSRMAAGHRGFAARSVLDGGAHGGRVGVDGKRRGFRGGCVEAVRATPCLVWRFRCGRWACLMGVRRRAEARATSYSEASLP